MLQFSLKRLFQSILVLIVMSFLLFVLIGLMPGDPIDNMFEGNPSLTPELMARMRELYGFDQPLSLRYWHWFSAAVQGDLGYSTMYFRPVMAVLAPAVLQTAKLLGLTLLFSVPLALLLGSLAARRPNGVLDSAIGIFSFAAISLPNFWVSLLFIILFSVTLGWLPASGVPMSNDASFLEEAQHLVLPVAVLVMFHVGPLIRYVRAAMIETLSADFVRTARAKGLDERAVIVRHALRNALIPMVTVLALSFGHLFSGALVIETIFGMLGMGKMIFDAIANTDFNLALIGLLLAITVVLVSNLVADLCYALLDPRITL
ncbi:peptide/nickel transport system permease protein [Pseudorhizobium tarimense]|uniref:Peptide/nickel transport system permease protein n=1 Tax=Pseudorhizobium tarimense TaxID=1079109 RepID=A0ABV2HBI7_9HYPH|nr:ABC transporter permease [Pseudorhizobium tarimense]MCJ8520921.1 ABC transporter permease [Pseudorhizobium tarimense]